MPAEPGPITPAHYTLSNTVISIHLGLFYLVKYKGNPTCPMLMAVRFVQISDSLILFVQTPQGPISQNTFSCVATPT